MRRRTIAVALPQRGLGDTRRRQRLHCRGHVLDRGRVFDHGCSVLSRDAFGIKACRVFAHPAAQLRQLHDRSINVGCDNYGPVPTRLKLLLCAVRSM
jgi:hypothetical protein